MIREIIDNGDLGIDYCGWRPILKNNSISAVILVYGHILHQ